MKIVYVANLRLPTDKAYGVQIIKMCQAFGRAGATVELLFPERHNPISSELFAYYGIEPNFTAQCVTAPDFYLPGRLDKLAVLAKNLLSAWRLSRRAAQQSADWYFTRDETVAILLTWLVPTRRTTYEAHKFSRYRHWLYQLLQRRGVRLVTISRVLQEKFLAAGWPSEQTLVAHDGVDLKQFALTLTAVEARQALALPLERSLAIYCGQFFLWKGAAVMARAARLLPGTDFIMIGGRSAAVADIKKRFGALSNLKVRGHQPHNRIPLWLRAATVLVLPNILTTEADSAYTSPLKLFEYMASGRPIVASDLPSLREVLDSNNAKLVPPGDPAVLARGIGELVANPAQAERLAEQAKRDVQQYSWEKRAGKILDFTVVS